MSDRADETIITSVVGLSDRGRVRGNNEDALIICDPYTGQELGMGAQLEYPVVTNRLLMIISDGMGGTAGGEVASRLTTSVMQVEIPRLPRELSAQSRLNAAIEEANATVRRERTHNIKLRTMGATVTAALVEGNTVYIAEVGDSRAYIVRGDRLKQLTTDQTMVQVMLDSGLITPQAAATSKNRNILLQAIGIEEHLQIAVNALELRRGDTLLLCSDGLSSKLNAQEMGEIIRNAASLEIAAQALVDEANERGGDDNITVILASFDGDGLNPLVHNTITRSLHILSRFDPEQEAQPKAKLLTRPATCGDWQEAGVFGYYPHTAQLSRFTTLDNYGQYIVCRRGDTLKVSCEPEPDTVYCLVSGRYRLVVETASKKRREVALIVAVTDMRPDEVIQPELAIRDFGYDTNPDGSVQVFVPIKRQLFVGSLAFLGSEVRSATLWCEDKENAFIQVPKQVYTQMGDILGERFLTALRYC